ncbi:UDP-glucuronosyltransferase 2B33-like [Bombus bifarius]|uniref:UDP-glucuronosyltransferase 2B33-like n=1 Tax=Bombus bifarius TaxID=103933 RepID=A0A6P8N9U0_9HYME|nr:UDP-glucuronosyltransferase 2B33-like [Bombus vancouverensis nearcticus]XP_033317124.1 UDP-glucuronosyltransferase 2B33-like [Bombus bifarius]
MKHHLCSLLFVVCVLYIAEQSECYKILAIVPTPSYSHQIPYRRLWLELHKRGHEVVLVTADPIPNIKSPNFTQIDISQSYGSIRSLDFVQMRFEGKRWLHIVEEEMLPIVEVFAETVLNSTELRKLYAADSNATFDVYLTEFLFAPATYAFAHRFNVPIIGLSSLGILAVNEHALGGVVLPSHEYTWEMEDNTGTNLPFLKRLYNFVNMWRSLYYVYHEIFPQQQKLAEKYFGPLPPMLDVLKNVSMLFINQADVMAPARPKLANVITFTSSHIEKIPKALPKDLQAFLDGATNGFIYFSLGSNARSASLPLEIRRMFCDVFAKLPYRVVWKFEEDFPGKPDNVYIGKWLPQQTILAHPNIKLFIYQGGLQSSEETVHYGVPVLGFAILADQDYQVARMEALGIGKYLEITTLKKDELENAITELITNKKYKERIHYIRNVVQDTPYDPVENLAWWTEYVIRTKGAPHLHSSLAFQPWYQRCDMDIVVFLTITIFLIASITFYLIFKIVGNIHKKIKSTKKQKIS